MRCSNCGWDNPEGNQKCEKCKSPLSATPSQNYLGTAREPINSVSNPVESTIRENASIGLRSAVCPKCGYPLAAGAQSCPMCESRQEGYAESSSQQQNRQEPSHYGGTMRSGGSRFLGGNNTFFTLKPIAWDGEDINYQPISYSGKTVILNRANTDANNQTITSREQALMTHESDGWYIENKSEFETTYVKVNKKTRLQNGDIILLGNRFFEFKGK